MQLFDEDVMDAVWKEEQKHIKCIQDPDPSVVQLYTETGSVTKGRESEGAAEGIRPPMIY